MKAFFITMFALTAISFAAKSQSCGIVFSYDDNGYRIKRQKECPALKPALDSTTISALSVPNDSLQMVNDLATFQVYPNPTTDRVDIRLNAVSLKSKCNITVVDVTGKTLKNQSIASALTEIDLTGIANGVYLFILQRGGQTNTVRVIKRSGLGDN